MNLFTYNPTAPCIALARVGKRVGNTVEFSRGNSVKFNRKGNGYQLNQIYNNYSFNLFMFTAKVDELNHEENVMLVAAMMVMGITSVMVGDNELISLGSPTGIIHTVIIDSPIPQPVRHASNWDKAREFGVSGHRHTESPKQTRTPVQPMRMPKTKLGWLALGAVTVLAIAATAVAASVEE